MPVACGIRQNTFLLNYAASNRRFVYLCRGILMQSSVRRLRYDTDDTSPPRIRRAKGPKEPRIGRSRTGMGVFARQRYRTGQIIGEIEGEVIDDADYSSRYCMDLGDTRCLEPSAPYRFVNHSCTPNCTFHWYDIDCLNGDAPQRRVFLLAKHPIESGEQLTIDYGWPPAMAIPCLCGVPECRGWIVDPQQLDALHQLLATQATGGVLN